MECVSLFVGIDVSKAHLDVAVHGRPRSHRFANTPPGRDELVAWLATTAPQLVVLEATGGYEQAIIAALLTAEVPVARANPAKVRYFAKGVGTLAKNDRLDAKVLAHYAALVDLPRLAPDEAQRTQLAALAQRRCQALAARQAERNRRDTAHPAVLGDLDAMIDAYSAQIHDLEARLAALVASVPALAEEREVLVSAPGVAAVVSTGLMARLPELGREPLKRVTALVGLAPFDDDSGTQSSPRHIRGGRSDVRALLYMATLVAVRRNPTLQAHYQQLLARGKPKKVALIACMRKLLGILHAMLRDRRKWQPAQIAA
jgi:transposase